MANRKKDDDDDSGFDTLWILVPLTALMIPITGIAGGDSAAIYVIAAVMVIATLGIVARSLLDRRHQHRIAEMEAQARIAAEEHRNLYEANQVLDRDDRIEELRRAIRQQQEVQSKESAAPQAETAAEEQG